MSKSAGEKIRFWVRWASTPIGRLAALHAIPGPWNFPSWSEPWFHLYQAGILNRIQLLQSFLGPKNVGEVFFSVHSRDETNISFLAFARILWIFSIFWGKSLYEFREYKRNTRDVSHFRENSMNCLTEWRLDEGEERRRWPAVDPQLSPPLSRRLLKSVTVFIVSGD